MPVSDDPAPRLSWRPATADDEAFCLSVYASTRAEELAAWGWSSAEQEIFLKMQFAAQAASHRSVFPGASRSIVLRGDRPVGTLIINYTADDIRLVDIALLPEHRGAGLGTEIVRRLQAEAHAAGRPVNLRVLRTNPALRLYGRLGFIAIGDDEMHIEMASRA